RGKEQELQAQACKAAEQRLARLRADPNRDEVVRFARDLTCEALRPQVLRLLESLGASLTAPPPAAVQASRPPTAPAGIGQSGIAIPKLNNDVEPNKAERKAGARQEAESDGQGTCRREEATLARLRASPERDKVIGFARNLACEQLRPQVTRL